MGAQQGSEPKLFRDGEVSNMDTMERIEFLRQRKSKWKASFTAFHHKLLFIITDTNSDRTEIQNVTESMLTSQETAADLMCALSDAYSEARDFERMTKVSEEIEQMFEESKLAQARAVAVIAGNTALFQVERSSDGVDELKQRITALEQKVEQQQQHKGIEKAETGGEKYSLHDRSPDQSSEHSQAIGQDLLNQLKKVSIPVFSGDKATYPGWRAAFYQCIDEAQVSQEYKLLHLKQCLTGEPLRLVERMGHSAAAYTTAKAKLDQKYGGKRRLIAAHLDVLERCKPLRDGNAKDFETFADLVDTAVLNLKATERYSELGNGTLYVTLLRKLSTTMIAQYMRWIAKEQKVESVESLKQWALEESEYQVIAAETVSGVGSVSQKSYFTNHKEKDSSRDRQCGSVCSVCGGRHNVGDCQDFRVLSVGERWDLVKIHRLCVRCLNYGHIGRNCRNSGVCAVEGCRNTHHRLLHQDQRAEQVKKQQSHSVVSTKTSSIVTQISPRTIPVVLRNGHKRVKVNALLDDACDRTYVNSRVTEELSLQGEKQKVKVEVINGDVKAIDSEVVKIGLESVDGQVKRRVEVFTVTSVTGDLKVADWCEQASRWDHLKDINFPEISSSPYVDMLIGRDQADLHICLQEVFSQRREPIARLTPLGWNCIGPV